ncbi:MAG: hypothetical protein ACD_20C00151G0005 [uncultured bacterium]|nr:MAG: hypothetical protein ACD_20C00151G0005 [uncultured bacterium]HBH18120.1 oxidoreductase [Cyanobacteria bacterium UBA9579]
MTLENKVAIVTGGGQGIGKAIAKRFLEDGLKVVIAEIDDEAGNETSQEFASLGNIKFIQTDVADENSVKNMINKTAQELGRIDILINNAGVFCCKPIEALSLDEWNKVISINLTGAFLCAKYCAPHLKHSKGTIINISSTKAFMSEPDTAAYSASKGGIYSLTHALAINLGPDIRVNCISPGWIEVSEWKKKSVKHKPELTEIDHKQHPTGRVGTPEDISSMAAYLVSDQASFITGSNFIIDGGMTKKMIYAD